MLESLINYHNLKRVHDVILSTFLWEKQGSEKKFSKEEIGFLYEIDEEILRFGAWSGEQIESLTERQKFKKKMGDALGVAWDKIGVCMDDFRDYAPIYFFGDITLFGEEIPDSFSQLRVIFGDFCANDLVQAKGLSHLEKVYGNVSLRFLQDASYLSRLQVIGGDVFFDDLESSKGLECLRFLGGNFYSDLKETLSLGQLMGIGGNLFLNELVSSKGLENLVLIGGSAHFRSLEDASGLVRLSLIGRSAYFSSLIDASGLEHLERVGGDVFIPCVSSGNGLSSLVCVGGDVDFAQLESVRGFHLDFLPYLQEHLRHQSFSCWYWKKYLTLEKKIVRGRIKK